MTNHLWGWPALLIASVLTLSLTAPDATAAPKCRSGCDRTAPAIAITAPAAGATVSGAVTVSGTSSDNVGVSSVSVAVDGGAWTAAAGTSVWSWTWDTTALPSGSHTIAARAVDKSGNVTSAAGTVQVSNPVIDTTAPSIAFTSPASGATVTGSTTVTGTASDNASVSSVEVRVDSGAWQPVSGTTTWSWTWTTTGLADGTHTLGARATDGAGNTASVTRSVTVSNSTSSGSTSSTPTAPSTQGTWVSPEGVTIDVHTAGSWTIAQVYTLLRDNGRDLDKVGPRLTIKVQDTYASQTTTSASYSGATLTGFSATMWLKGVDSTFAYQPDKQFAHEFGHAWIEYFGALRHGGRYDDFVAARWSTSDGSVTLAQDSRTGTSYTWDPAEIAAEDYRILFGSAAAAGPHMNSYIVDPRYQAGLRDWLLTGWAG